mmetsp:Transcript_32416/g.49296  ORF Transcript_32416/g.49296 Transcript_32416/m.49296 type:complete len:446 (-) Transcript_32416:112-1449(-)
MKMRSSMVPFVLAFLSADPGVSGFTPLLLSKSKMYQSVHGTITMQSMPAMMSEHSAPNDKNDSSTDMTKNQPTKNPTPILVSMFKDATNNNKATKKMIMQMAAAVTAFALAFMPLNNADAAMTGGRMGGSFSAPRQSTSRPSSSSYGQGFSRGYSSGHVSRPSVTIAPSYGGYGYSPFISPFSPFMQPRFYGGPGAVTVFRGPNFFDLLFFGGIMLAVSQVFRSTESLASSSSGVFSDWSSPTSSTALGSGTSLVQISVALEVPDRDDRNSILSVLNRLSHTARTDSRVGIQNLSSQVALELLRRRSSIVSANAFNQHFRDRNNALREFQNRSVKERSKFERETVSQYGGVDYGASSSPSLPSREGDGKATMAVVTLILAIDGDSTKLNRIGSISDVDQALRQIASDSKVDDCLQSAEILWTPEDRSETLSVRDVIADYPELRSV